MESERIEFSIPYDEQQQPLEVCKQVTVIIAPELNQEEIDRKIISSQTILSVVFNKESVGNGEFCSINSIQESDSNQIYW